MITIHLSENLDVPWCEIGVIQSQQRSIDARQLTSSIFTVTMKGEPLRPQGMERPERTIV
jgi:hypothetical protein